MANHLTQTETATILREEIARFVEAAHERSECDAIPRRRARRRYHRSWPLLVSRGRRGESTDLSVALHNASECGLAFLSSERFCAGEVIFVKLFWHDPAALRVPSMIRHITRVDHGWLLGCEFLLDDATSGGHTLDTTQRWYDEAI